LLLPATSQGELLQHFAVQLGDAGVDK